MTDIKYKAFISYSHIDERWGSWLHRSLEKYRIPRHLVNQMGLNRNRLGLFFRDKEELAASSNLSDTIREALKASENLIVICSLNAASSQWVEEEVQRFIQLGRRASIFCLVVDGSPNNLIDECLPPGLRTSDGSEPLGADVQTDGKSHALDRIVAGLLGTNYGTFTQRLYRNRQKRLVIISIAALVGLAVATTLASLAFLGQQRAQQESARATAVRKFMEDVMLAPDPLAGEGKDITVLEALDRSVSEVDRIFLKQPDSQASAMNSIGRVYLNLGRNSEAEPLLNQALSVRTELYGPEHKDVAETHDLLGTVNKNFSRYEESEDHYLHAISIYENLLGINSVPTVESKLNLIRLLTQIGRYEDADILAENLDSEQLRANDKKAYLGFRDTMGTLAWNQGQYSAAAEHYESYLDVTKKVYGQSHPLVGSAQNNLAVVYENTGRVDDAKQLLRNSLQIFIKTLGKDHEEVAVAHLNLAVLLDTHGELEGAKNHYSEALRIDRLQFGSTSFQVATDMVNYAPLLCTNKSDETGLKMIIQAQGIFEDLLEADHWRIGNAHRWRGDCLKSLGRYADAEFYLKSALNRMIKSFGDSNYRTEAIIKALDELYEEWDGEQSEQ